MFRAKAQSLFAMLKEKYGHDDKKQWEFFRFAVCLSITAHAAHC
jgi:hypothetical protein